MIKEEEDKIPVFKKWAGWYWLVIGFELLLIAIFYIMTKHFS